MEDTGRLAAAAVLRRRAERSNERADVLRAVLQATSRPGEPEPEAA